MKNTNRQIRLDIANNTLKILNEGVYENKKGERINIDGSLKIAISNSLLFKENDFLYWNKKRDELFLTNQKNHTHFEVTTETSIEACLKLKKESINDKILCLNFASAVSEGGGFLKGAVGQEESLARVSGLYPCLTKFHTEFYQKNRSESHYYTSDIIYSPNVPIISNDKGELLDSFCEISFLTSPAVHLGRIHRYNFWNLLTFNSKNLYNDQKYTTIMLQRLEYILTLAYLQNYKTLVLGAWGCGVFKNNPEKIVTFFDKYLKKDGIFENRFEKIVFAIFDKDQKTKNFEIFDKFFN